VKTFLSYWEHAPPIYCPSKQPDQASRARAQHPREQCSQTPLDERQQLSWTDPDGRSWPHPDGLGSSGRRNTAEDLTAVAAELNNRPRKTLDWDSPAQRFARLLAEVA